MGEKGKGSRRGGGGGGGSFFLYIAFYMYHMKINYCLNNRLSHLPAFLSTNFMSVLSNDKQVCHLLLHAQNYHGLDRVSINDIGTNKCYVAPVHVNVP